MQINKQQNIKERIKNTKITYQEIIRKNLKKYIVSQNRYNRYIINHLIYIRKKTIVSRFKDHLIMDDIGEYLKRFYKLNESDKRIPKISEYYQKYSLFSPVYIAYEYPITSILKKFCKRKKKYLANIEEFKGNIKKKDNNNTKNDYFELIIKPEMVKSIISKENTIETIELTDYNDIEKSKNKQNNNLSKLMKDLSSSIEAKNQKDLLKMKLENLKQTKNKIEKKFFLKNNTNISSRLSLLEREKSKIHLLKNEKPKLTILNNIHKSKVSLLKKEQSNYSSNQNNSKSPNFNQSKDKIKEEKKFPLKLTKKILALKLNFNNIQKETSTIPILPVSLTEKFIPKNSDELIKEKLGWLKKNKIKLKTNQFTDSIFNKNYSNTSRNKNRINHLVIKQISTQYISSKTISNDSKLIKSSEPPVKNKTKTRIKLEIKNDIYNTIIKSRNHSKNNIIGKNSYSNFKHIHITENNTSYPLFINKHHSSGKYLLSENNSNSKKKCFMKKRVIKNEGKKKIKFK